MSPRLFLVVLLIGLTAGPLAAEQERPNILWLCGEDLGPHLSPYDDPHAETPNIDALAEGGLTYRVAWSSAPVCAPARTTLATGMYAPSLGAEHMRSFVALPDGAVMYQQKLREAGYDTANHGKQDFNVPRTGKLWSSDHQPEEAEAPFFIKLNYGHTHESGVGHASAQIEEEIGEYELPAFQPDIPEMHRNWATYHDRISRFDEWVKGHIQKLKTHDLWEETIVVLWGDHGPGLPWGKRFVRDYGLRTPLIVRVPEKYRDLAPDDYEPGEMTDRLVSFVDFGPTMLSLAGVEPPELMQGRPFMGEYEDEPRDYIFGFRGRMDERIDMSRTVRDGRYQLIRNYMPHRPYGQHLQYLHRNPVMDKWQRLTEAGEIDPPASFYWREKPAIELYDLQRDPDGVRNLAYDPEHQSVRRRLMEALHRHQEEIRDIGFLPEAHIHDRPGEAESPYAYAHDADRYPLQRIRAMAEVASRRNMDSVPQLLGGLESDDPAIRYWAATGLLVRGADAVWPHRDRLIETIHDDPAPTVRVVAAEALARYGNEGDRRQARQALTELANPEKSNAFSSVAALNTIDGLGRTALPMLEDLKAMPERPSDGPKRASGYSQRLLEKIVPELEAMGSQ